MAVQKKSGPSPKKPNSPFFDVDTLSEIRDRTRTFLKLDLAYLAAGGAIFTALQIGRDELIEFGARMSCAATAVVIIGLIDTTIDSMVFGDWLAARSGTAERSSSRTIWLFLNAQPWIHLGFVAALVIGSVGYVTGARDTMSELESRALVQEAVEQFISIRGVPPKNLGQLRRIRQDFDGIVEKLNGEAVRIEGTGEKTYKITFGGWDKVLGTADDQVVTQDLSLRKVIDEVKSDSKKRLD